MSGLRSDDSVKTTDAPRECPTIFTFVEPVAAIAFCTAASTPGADLNKDANKKELERKYDSKKALTHRA